MALDSKDAATDEFTRYIERDRQRAMLDDRPIDEILGYDRDGLPEGNDFSATDVIQAM